MIGGYRVISTERLKYEDMDQPVIFLTPPPRLYIPSQVSWFASLSIEGDSLGDTTFYCNNNRCTYQFVSNEDDTITVVFTNAAILGSQDNVIYVIMPTIRKLNYSLSLSNLKITLHSDYRNMVNINLQDTVKLLPIGHYKFKVDSLPQWRGTGRIVVHTYSIGPQNGFAGSTGVGSFLIKWVWGSLEINIGRLTFRYKVANTVEDSIIAAIASERGEVIIWYGTKVECPESERIFCDDIIFCGLTCRRKGGCVCELY